MTKIIITFGALARGTVFYFSNPLTNMHQAPFTKGRWRYYLNNRRTWFFQASR